MHCLHAQRKLGASNWLHVALRWNHLLYRDTADVMVSVGYDPEKEMHHQIPVVLPREIPWTESYGCPVHRAAKETADSSIFAVHLSKCLLHGGAANGSPHLSVPRQRILRMALSGGRHSTGGVETANTSVLRSVQHI